MDTVALLQKVRSIFDPLAQRLGLDDPLEIRHSNTSFSIAYAGVDVGLQITIDIGYFFIYALIFKPSAAGTPVGYRNAEGVRHKLYITEALSELSIDCKEEILALQRLGGNHENYDEMASRLARLVEDHWPAITARGVEWFR